MADADELPVVGANGDDEDVDDEQLVEKIKRSLARIVDDLTTVRVITAIADPQVQVMKHPTEDKRTQVRIEINGKHSAFVTELDLVDGDVRTFLPTDHPDHPAVKALHEKNAEEASKVLIKNIEALGNAATAIIQAIRQG